MACVNVYYPSYKGTKEDATARYVEGYYNLYQQDEEFKQIIQQFFSVAYDEENNEINFLGVPPISSNFSLKIKKSSSYGVAQLYFKGSQILEDNVSHGEGTVTLMKPKNGGLIVKWNESGNESVNKRGDFIITRAIDSNGLIRYIIIYHWNSATWYNYSCKIIYNENTYNLFPDIYYSTNYRYNADFLGTSDDYILYPFENNGIKFLDLYTYDYGKLEIPPNNFIEIDDKLFYSLFDSENRKFNYLIEIDTANEWEVTA